MSRFTHFRFSLFVKLSPFFCNFFVSQKLFYSCITCLKFEFTIFENSVWIFQNKCVLFITEIVGFLWSNIHTFKSIYVPLNHSWHSTLQLDFLLTFWQLIFLFGELHLLLSYTTYFFFRFWGVIIKWKKNIS
jgi:hypothetical protein